MRKTCFPQFVLVSLLLVLTGCAGYRRKPLVDRQVLRELNNIRVEALQPQAGQTAGMSLDSDRAVAIALKWNPELRAFRGARGVAEGKVIAARLLPNPEIQIGVLANLSGGGLGSTSAASLLALPRPGERDARVRLARARVEQVSAEISTQEWKLAGEVRKTFLGLVAGRARLRLAEGSLKLQTRLRALYRDKEILGDATRLDINLVEIDYLASLREFELESAQIPQAEQTLFRGLGFPPNAVDRIEDVSALEYRPVALNASELESLLMERNSGLAAKKHVYEQSEQNLRLAYIQRVPWFRFGPGFERESGGGEATTDRLGLQLGIDLPIFNFNQGEIAIRTAERERARDEYAASLFVARSELNAIVKRIQSQERLIQLFRNSIQPAIDENAKLNEAGFKLREFNLAQWVATQDKVFKSQRDYVDAELEYWRAVIDLETLLESRLMPAALPSAGVTP
jgi:outer membrane protein, heavy metal efflux system